MCVYKEKTGTNDSHRSAPAMPLLRPWATDPTLLLSHRCDPSLSLKAAMPGTHAGNTTALPKRAAQAAVLSNCPRLERISSFLKEDNCSILKLSGSRRKTQARGSDALSLGWETGGVQGRAAARLLCWGVKVLDETHESSCCVPSPAKPVLLETAETPAGEVGAPPRGTDLRGWALLKARGEKLLVEHRASVSSHLCPPPPASSGFWGHKGGPRSTAGQPLRPVPLHGVVRELAL